MHVEDIGDKQVHQRCLRRNRIVERTLLDQRSAQLQIPARNVLKQGQGFVFGFLVSDVQVLTVGQSLNAKRTGKPIRSRWQRRSKAF